MKLLRGILQNILVLVWLLGCADSGGPSGGVDAESHSDEPQFGDYWSRVPAGVYRRGAATPAHEGPPHEVELTHSILMGRGEITRAEWRVVMGTSPAGHGCDDCPVEQVSWYEALVFANRLSADNGLDECYQIEGCQGEDIGAGCADDLVCYGDFFCTSVEIRDACLGFRLPTEAEWEVAARAGVEDPYWFGEADVNAHENCAFEGGPMETLMQRAPNPFGLHHMLGNVVEWVFDIAEPYDVAQGVVLVDPVVDFPSSWFDYGPTRIARGGSPNDEPDICRASSRRGFSPHARANFIGLRLVRTLDD